jgi:hypothetical protein
LGGGADLPVRRDFPPTSEASPAAFERPPNWVAFGSCKATYAVTLNIRLNRYSIAWKVSNWFGDLLCSISLALEWKLGRHGSTALPKVVGRTCGSKLIPEHSN